MSTGVPPPGARRPGRMARLGLLLLRPLLVLPAAWGAAALWFDGPRAPGVAAALAAVFAAASLLLLFGVRPFRRGLLGFSLLLGAVITWWLAIPPRGDRDWQDDVAVVPRVQVRGEQVVVQGVRNATWHCGSGDEVRWETRAYDLGSVVGLDLFLCSWGPRAIAHTILSWEFADGRHLAISIETRKERGEEYSAVRGFFRQYELYYVVADERDVIGVRARCRGEEVYLYRLRTPPWRARALLLDSLAQADALARRPEWYHALDANCTTQIFEHVRRLVGHVPLDARILLNGYLDELLWEEGIVNTTMPSDVLRTASRVDARLRAAGPGQDLSAIAREGLPARPPPPPGEESPP